MISEQYDYIKNDPEAPTLKRDDFFPDKEAYKENLIKHQVRAIYDLLIGKLTPGQLKKIADSHHKYSKEIKEVHFNEVVNSVGNYIKDRFWWAPLINSFFANKVKDCLTQFRPYVLKSHLQSESNNISEESHGLSDDVSKNLEVSTDQVSTTLDNPKASQRQMCVIL